MENPQINVRLTQDQLEAVDRKRIELQPVLGKIATRSDVLRYALDEYLGLVEGSVPTKSGPTDRRSNSSKKKSG